MTLNSDSRPWWNTPWNAPWFSNLLKIGGSAAASHTVHTQHQKTNDLKKISDFRRQTALTKGDYTPEQAVLDAGNSGKSIKEIKQELVAWGKVDQGTNFSDDQQFTVTERWDKMIGVAPTKRTVGLVRHPEARGGRGEHDFTLNRQNMLTPQGLSEPARRDGTTSEVFFPVPSESREINFHKTRRNVQANDIEDQVVYGVEPERHSSTFSFVSSQPMWYQSSAFFGVLFLLASAVYVVYGDNVRNWVKTAIGLKPKNTILKAQNNSREEENLESQTPVTSANLDTLLDLFILHKSKKISKTAALHILEKYYHKTPEEALRLLEIP